MEQTEEDGSKRNESGQKQRGLHATVVVHIAHRQLRGQVLLQEQGFLRVALKKRGWRKHDKSPLGNEYEGSIKNIRNFINVKV